MTKMNVTIDISLKDILMENYDNYNENGNEIEYSFEKEILSEVKYQVSKNIVKNIVEKNLITYDENEDIKNLKEVYNAKLLELSEKTKNLEKILEDKANKFLENMLKGIFVKVNSWGEVEKETTVENVIKEKIFNILENKGKIENIVNKMATNIIDEKLKLTKYELENIVNKYAQEIKQENIKKVTEFLINGIK
jgi:hypothetical protein